MAERITCKSCVEGVIVFPRAPTLDGGELPATNGWCLACGGWGYFLKVGNDMRYAREPKIEDCPQ